jgi:hypothetical protein
VAIARLSLDVRSGGLIFISGSFGLVALVVLGSALVLARPWWIGAALGLLALLYLGHVLVAGESDMLTVAVVSLALLLVGELGQWSVDSRLTGRYEPGLHVSRAIGIAQLVALGFGIVVVAEVAAGLPITGGVWTVAAAVAASVALLGVISILALRAGDRR